MVLDLQARQAQLQPADQLLKLFAGDGCSVRERSRLARNSRLAVLHNVIDPELGTGAEEQGILKALLLQVMQQIFIGGQSAGAFALAAVPLVQDKGEGAALSLLQE